MSLQAKETETPPKPLSDISSDSPSERGSLIDQLSESYLKLLRDGYPLSIYDYQPVASPTDSPFTWKSFLLGTYDEPEAPKNLISIFIAGRKKELDISGEIFPAELTGILTDLQEAADEAHEEGFPVPSDMAIANSERLIKEIYGILPGRHGVYPTQDGEIAIDIFNGKGNSVVLLCDSAGGALCLVNIEGNRRRAHYSKTDTLPDGFVREALNELKLQVPAARP